MTNLIINNLKGEIDADYEAASRIQASFRGYLERKELATNQASKSGFKVTIFYACAAHVQCADQLDVIYFLMILLQCYILFKLRLPFLGTHMSELSFTMCSLMSPSNSV